MIANARMYSVSPEVASRWRELLEALIDIAGVSMEVLDYPAPAPLEELWAREDLGAVFMCGLPFSSTDRQPALIAAPVPSPAGYAGEARYWSEWIVRRETSHREVADTFGGRIALTVRGSQSGFAAPLRYLESYGDRSPLFQRLIEPTITPLGALAAVIDGRADIAPIDSFAFALLQRYRPDLLSQVQVVGRTLPTPIPPLVASGEGIDSLRQAFCGAHTNPVLKPLLAELLLERFVVPQAADYAALKVRYQETLHYWRHHRLADSAAGTELSAAWSLP